MNSLREHYEFQGNYYCFSDYIELSEALNPTPTAFGTDGTNTKFVDGTTRVDIAGTSFIVMVEKKIRPGWYEVAFGQLIPGKDASRFDAHNYTMSDQIPSDNFITTFGKILYVIITHTRTLNDLNYLQFSGGYDKIRRFYRTLLTNDNFVKTLKSYGYEVDTNFMSRKGGEFFILKRIDK